MSHLNWLMGLGGVLRGTLPNPEFSAQAMLEMQVFGARSQVVAPLSEESTVQIVEEARTFAPHQVMAMSDPTLVPIINYSRGLSLAFSFLHMGG